MTDVFDSASHFDAPESYQQKEKRDVDRVIDNYQDKLRGRSRCRSNMQARKKRGREEEPGTREHRENLDRNKKKYAEERGTREHREKLDRTRMQQKKK